MKGKTGIFKMGNQIVGGTIVKERSFPWPQYLVLYNIRDTGYNPPKRWQNLKWIRKGRFICDEDL